MSEFWDDLREDLKDPEFRRAYVAECMRIWQIDATHKEGAFKVKYVVEAEEDDGWHHYAQVCQVEEDGTRTEVGWIGGEPEDNTSYRTYSWIEGALNDAYQRGVLDGRNSTTTT